VATARRRRGDGASGAPYGRGAGLHSSCQSCHFDMGGGDSAVGTNALARDALASSSGMLVPLQSRRTVDGKRAGRQSSVKQMCNTVAHVEVCCIAGAKKKY